MVIKIFSLKTDYGLVTTIEGKKNNESLNKRFNYPYVTEYEKWKEFRRVLIELTKIYKENNKSDSEYEEYY